MAKKRIQSRYLLDNRLIPAPRRLPDQDSSATDGNQRLRQRRIHLCRTNATPMGSRFSRIYHLCLRKRDGLSPHTVALLLTGLRTSVPEDCHHQKVYRHGFNAQNELLPLASDRRTGMAHRNQAISAPHPDWRFGRQRRRTAGILYTGRNTGHHRICPSTEYHHRPRNRYAGPCRSCSLCLSGARLFRIAGRDTAKRIYPEHILCRKRRNSPFPEKRTG